MHRLTPTIIEVVIRAPAAARAFRPGQFYRLQNFEVLAPQDDEPGIGRTLLNMEGLAMTGAWTDPEQGLVSVIALEMGGSSDLCAMLQPGEPVILMGPTGTPTEIHANTTVALVGGGLGNAVLFSIGAATRAAGSKVIYFAGYKAMRDRYKVPEIERAADVIVWCCDEAPGFAPNPARPQDRTFVGNIVQAMAAYGSGALGEQAVPLADADHMIVIGSDRMMQAVGAARHGLLAPLPEAGTQRDRVDQLPHAMHDEGGLRAVPAAADRPGNRRADGCVLLLQPGPGAGPRRFPGAARTARAERHAGETDRAMDRPCAAPPGDTSRRCG